MRVILGCMLAALLGPPWWGPAEAREGGGGARPAEARPGAAAACGRRPEVLALLAERRGETRRGIGMHGSGRVVEVFASEGGGWTVIATEPSGRTCVIAAGHGWEDLREAPPPPGVPA
ncbi:hypothetical protein BCF33_1543 [Hasllibacter halocynthiae]|uniref:Uncharacterized protein n=1 Tax=Hasllibacter halocynthiae TaxID=595589 RepID=A0A2T0X178_9RHOB|nr:hypothetical protein [Hasllibacter halocynthiae]PRY92690.1 hypothetical protein BCF33_1543 [Hasllibacter halocynthiae]